MKMRMSLVMKCRDTMACMVLLAMLGVGVAVAEEPVIREIRILDAQGRAYDISLVEAYTTFSAGDVAPERSALIEAIRVDVDRMRDSGHFSYVDAQLLMEPSGLVVMYEVEPKQRLRRIEIRGADKLGNKKVREKCELELGSLVDDADFEQAVAKVRAAYRDFWYPDVGVSWSAEVDRELGAVDLLMEIDEGVKVGIKRIEFVGNHTISADDLRKVMMQKQKGWLRLFTHSGRFHPEFEDVDYYALKTLYMNNGFLDVQLEEAQLLMEEPRRAVLRYEIDEGRRYEIESFSVKGTKVFAREVLESRILLRAGDVAAFDAIEAGREAIRAYYGNRGFVRTRVNAVTDTDALAGVVRVVYEVEEGEKGTIARVAITGNERTRDEVIRRELVVLPGEEYNRSRLLASENRLRNLNYFETVSVSPEPTEREEQYDVLVKVKEKPTGQFNAGVGLSSVDSLVGFVQLSQGNFDWRRWPPIGGGQKFQVRAQLGTRRNDLEVSFTEPWFLDRKLSFGVNLYHRESRYFSDIYDQKTDGARLSLGQPLSRNMRHSLGYSFEQFEVFNVADMNSIFWDERGKRLASSVDYSLSYDSRDRFFGATRGNRSSLKPYLSGGFLGGETDLYGMELKTTQHTPLVWDMVFTTRAQVESVEAFGESEFVPIFDRLFLGGSYTLRGYEYREVGPRQSEVDTDYTGSIRDSIGGNSYAFASAELTVPLWNNVRGAVFYDWGFVNYDSWDFDPGMFNDNYGVGVRLKLPGFPLQLDYAWPVTFHEERGETGKARFNFLMGHTY